MLTRVLAVLVMLFIAAFVIQILFARGGTRKISFKQYTMWDVAPVTGFLGAVLLALSFAEAARREVLDAWRWGLAFGFVFSVGIGLAVIYRWNHRAPKKESTARAILGFIRTYGLVLLFAILGVTLAVRFIGASLEVFIGGALGVVVIAMAVAVFANAWRRRSEDRIQPTDDG